MPLARRLFVLLVTGTLVACGKSATRAGKRGPDGASDGAVVPTLGHLQGEMAAEVTDHGAILQSRLTALEPAGGDVPGAPGVARFEIARDEAFGEPRRTDWLTAEPSSDFVVRAAVDGLDPATRYFFRLELGEDRARTRRGPTRSFRTLPGASAVEPARFAVVTGMHYGRFRSSPNGAAPGADLGYPALVAIRNLAPDFFVGTGDNVYYDHDPPAWELPDLRRKWHEQLAQQRFVDLFSEVPTYWEKDDHDFRYDDADTTGVRPPSPELGARVFLEQLPVVRPGDAAALTYRTHRVSRLLQIWLIEGRDYRSPNAMPDGPGKTLWGDAQKRWLEETLLASDATFRIVIHPTPMVGPDDARKRDNHADPDGFLTEGDGFFSWAKDHGLLERGLYLVCGDRHWQYHSIHPSGFEEFSVGALVDGNSRLGVPPGQGTDPDARIVQPYSSAEPSGGFLFLRVEPAGREAKLVVEFYDENGVLLHSVERTRAIE